MKFDWIRLIIYGWFGLLEFGAMLYAIQQLANAKNPPITFICFWAIISIWLANKVCNDLTYAIIKDNSASIKPSDSDASIGRPTKSGRSIRDNPRHTNKKVKE